MGVRKSPGAGDRHDRGTRRGTPVGVAATHKAEKPAPLLKPGQRRCPVCRNAVSTTRNGYLRKHLDLFGERCWNKATGDPIAVGTPPVVIPPAAVPAPRPQSTRRHPPIPRPPGEPSRLDVGSECRECGKWLPGERSLCGRCYAIGGR